MLKLNYFLADIFILSAEKQPIKLSWRKIEWLHGKNLILDFVRSQYLTDLQVVPDTGDWIYYSPATEKWVINSYHPSARIGYEECYVGMMNAFHLALSRKTL